MALTSQQKHYIKKNVKKLSPEQIALNLDLPFKEIDRYVEKRWPKIKIKGGAGKNGAFNEESLSSFRLVDFIKNNINAFILLFLLVAASYANSLGNDFVSDDIAAIAKNGDVGKISYAFSNLAGATQNIYYFLAFHIGGLNPGYFRIFNILLHLGSSILIFTILSLLAKRRIAIFASVIFAVHPFFTESITWISGMPYALYGFLFLLSFLFYILYRQKPSKKLLAASYFAFFLTLVSTQNAAPLFVIFFIWEYMLGGLKKNWKRLLPYLSLSFFWIAMFAARISARTEALVTQFYQPKTSQSMIVQVPVAIAKYFKLLLWPDKLALYHTEMQFSPGAYVLMLLIFIIYLAAILYCWKKNKPLSFLLAFFVIVLSPTLTPLGVSWIVAERYAYLASAGIIIVFAIFYDWLMEKGGEKYKYVFYGVMALIVVSLSARTIVRNIDWKNEDNLWIATAEVSPSGAPIHNNLGDVYARRKDYPKAVEEFTKATQINPGYADAYHNLANTHQMMGNVAEAEKYYSKALSINPRIWQSHQNLAAIYFEQGEKQKALESIQKAIALNPNEPGLQANMKIIQGEAPASVGAPQPPMP